MSCPIGGTRGARHLDRDAPGEGSDRRCSSCAWLGWESLCCLRRAHRRRDDGPSPFPPIGQLAYLLTMPPYGFYWFQIVENAETPRWRQAPPEQMPDFLHAGAPAGTEGRAQRAAGRAARAGDPARLPGRCAAGLPARASKINEVRIAYAGAARFLRGHPHHRGRDAERRSTERYLVPLAVAWEGVSPPPLPQQLALARVRRGRRVGFLTDAFSIEAFARAFMRGLKRGATVPTPDGEIRCLPSEALAAVEEPERATSPGCRPNSQLVAARRQLRDGQAHPAHPAGRPSRGGDDAPSHRGRLRQHGAAPRRGLRVARTGRPTPSPSSRAPSATRATRGPGRWTSSAAPLTRRRSPSGRRRRRTMSSSA